jgi:hypothetical protein
MYPIRQGKEGYILDVSPAGERISQINKYIMGLLPKIILVVVVIGAIVLGVRSRTDRQDDQMTSGSNTTEVQTDTTLTTGTSNSDLDKDMAAIDSQLTVINQSSTDIDNSFSEQSSLEAQ